MTLPEGKKGAKIGVQLIRLFSCTKNTHNSDYYFLFFNYFSTCLGFDENGAAVSRAPLLGDMVWGLED